MPQERRFLIASSLARLIQKERGLGSRIVEGYFAPRPDRKQVVRIENGGAQLILISTPQGGTPEEERAEVPRAHAEALLDVAQGKVAFARGTVPLAGGREVALDRFMIPARIDILTVTFADGEGPDAFQAPAWFGREITGDASYELNAIAIGGVPEVGDIAVSNSALESLLDALEQRFGFRSSTGIGAGMGSRAPAQSRPAPRPEPARAEPPPPMDAAPAPAAEFGDTFEAPPPPPIQDAASDAPPSDDAPPPPPPASDPDDVLANLARALAPRRPVQR
jgi:CYTH domain-containing protein